MRFVGPWVFVFALLLLGCNSSENTNGVITSAGIQSKETTPARPVEDALIKIVASKTSTPEARWFCCRMLQRVGTEKCVGTLVTLLGDKQMSHYARLTLERMTDSSSAGAGFTRST